MTFATRDNEGRVAVVVLTDGDGRHFYAFPQHLRTMRSEHRLGLGGLIRQGALKVHKRWVTEDELEVLYVMQG